SHGEVIDLTSMKLMRRLLTLTLLATAAYAIPPQSNCTTSAASFPIFSTLATTGFVGDYVLSCTNTGFIDGTPGTLQFNFFTFVPQINSGLYNLTDGFNNYAGTFIAPDHVQFNSVVYDPNLTLINFEVSGIEVNPSLNPPGFLYHEALGVNGTI